MAEYLSPAVYVEEVDTGAKPIEGVSTSTAGMVGVAERGPVNTPILVTSIGEYSRWFGDRIPRRDFVDAADPDRAHCYLPHAVEGFFLNGGKRVYVVRVAPPEAQNAATFVFDRGDPALAGTMLLRRASQGDGFAGGDDLYVLDTTAIGTALAANDSIRIGDGSRAEYRQASGPAVAAAQHLALSGPLQRAHASGETLSINVEAPGTAAGPHQLGAAAAAGATTLVVDSPDDLTAEPVPFLIEVSTDGRADIMAVRVAPVNVTGNLYRVTLNHPLAHAHVGGADVTIFASQASANTLDVAATPGDRVVFADADMAFNATEIVEIDEGGDNHEAKRRGDLSTLPLVHPLVVDAPAGTELSHVDLTALAATALTTEARSGSRTIVLASRADVAVGRPVQIGAGPDPEIGLVTAIPGGGGAAPDPGPVTLATPLAGAHASGVPVTPIDPIGFPAGGQRDTALMFAAAAGATSFIAGDGSGLASGDTIRLRRPDGVVSFHEIGAPAGFASAGRIQLTGGLARAHEIGAPLLRRDALLEVQALDAGSWGSRLLISTEDERVGLAARTQTSAVNAPLEIRLVSLTGIESGTLVELSNPATGGRALLKVRRIDRSNRSVTFDAPGLNAAALADLGPIVGPLEVRSREFALTIQLRRRPDPAVPSRDSLIVESESFRHLSMDHRHSRYFQSVIGDINGSLRLEDRRPEGNSRLIRVADLDPGNEAIRLGPETLVDLMPTGLAHPAQHPLEGGEDSVATITAATYLGADNVEPLQRTGLQALRNYPNISIVAIPGQGAADIQAGLIAHCELMRYRFAVLDADLPEGSLADVQAQRQNFDTKYAGLYYPWLTIPDPHPETLSALRDFALPPSGHMAGIYARTDEERGVHKAPANEVVRGITGLTRRLNKGEHDILNPFPVNINVIRDFRPDGRGIRAWGARCITSDSDHKYVPVRRLLIFLEQSIERGLQWVVFEPNAQPLWARVRRSVGNFLTDVWRSGALEGVKPEEAFFVKCDRTTMTQSDIDNGRLIVLVGVAPVKPAEFVIVRIGLSTAQSES